MEVRAEFVQSSPTTSSLPKSDLLEVAVVGRSNVGKSTLINRLCGKKKLARTSSTPGRTQELVFFKVTFDQRAPNEFALHLVDLPGFGYAKLSKEKRKKLLQLIAAYVQHREKLQLVLLLNDCRRDPGEEELQIREMVFNADVHLMVVLTKSDKLKRGELNTRRQEIAVQYGLEPADVLLTGEGLTGQEIWQRAFSLVGE